MTRPEYRHPRMVVCEGPEDVALFQRLVQLINQPHKHFHVEATSKKRGLPGGNTNFEQKLRALRVSTGFQHVNHLLLVSDNDENQNESFKKIQEQIEKAGFGPAPPQPLSRSTGKPSVTIMMLPLEDEPGTLENVLAKAARDREAQLSSVVDEFLARIKADAWPTTRKAKAWIRVFLTAMCSRDPLISIRAALRDDRQERLIPIDHACFKPIIAELAKMP